MEQNRREFIQTFSMALATAASGLGFGASSPAKFALGAFGGIGKLNTMEEAAFSLAELALTAGIPDREWVRIGQDLNLDGGYADGLTSFDQWRSFLKKSPPEYVEQLLAHRKEAVKWLSTLGGDTARAENVKYAADGMEQAVRILHMSDAEFAHFRQQHVQDILKCKQQVRKEQQQGRVRESQQQLADLAPELSIRWDTIDGATTRRIKITVPETNQPEALIAKMGESLKALFPSDDIDVNHSENRIYIRNPSKAAVETLKPYLLQKNQHRQL